MNRKATILPFTPPGRAPATPLEELLAELEDPENAIPCLLFQDAGAFWGCVEDEELVFLDDGYFLIDGSEGVIDVLLSRKATSLAALLANGDTANPAAFARDGGLPLVRDVEVLLTGDTGITRRGELAGLGILTDGASLALDGRWERIAARRPGVPHATETWTWREGGLLLETTLAAKRLPPREEAPAHFSSAPEGNPHA